MTMSTRAISEYRKSIDEQAAEREEKVEARNTRIARLYGSGLPVTPIAEAADVSGSYVRKLGDLYDFGRSESRPVGDADHVQIEWLRTVASAIRAIDATLATLRESRNTTILAAVREGERHQVLADAAGVGRSWVSRLVNES